MMHFFIDTLSVSIYPDRSASGLQAAIAGGQKLREILSQKGEANIIFAAAPSQNEVLEALIHAQGIAWQRVNAFHMDNYLGLDAQDPAQFSRFLEDRLFSRLPFKTVNLMGGRVNDLAAYDALIQRNPPDICFMGIGENGHIAFNDPDNANFYDPEAVKIVELDAACRTQQVNDRCFASFDEVPTHALTLTIPTLMSSKHLICTVPSKTKAEAVKNTLTGPVDQACPASILRRHPSAFMFLETDSASLLPIMSGK